MHISNFPHKSLQNAKKQLWKQPKLLEKGLLSFLCNRLWMLPQWRVSCYKKSASSTNVWLFNFCLIASLLFRCIAIFFLELIKFTILSSTQQNIWTWLKNCWLVRKASTQTNKIVYVFTTVRAKLNSLCIMCSLKVVKTSLDKYNMTIYLCVGMYQILLFPSDPV